MVQETLTPTLFDKLVGGLTIAGLTDQSDDKEERIAREQFRNYAIPDLNRFNEKAMRQTLRRDLAWLLNTTNLGASVDLEDYPNVVTSVLKFGVPDLAGQAASRTVIRRRAREIRKAILTFEPRFEEAGLRVEPLDEIEKINSVTYVISGDIGSAVRAMPVKFKTDVDAEIASVDVRE